MEAVEEDIEVRNKETIRASFQAWRNGTGRVFDLLEIDATWTVEGSSPVSGTYNSRQEFLESVIDPFNARLSSRLIPSVRGIYSDGDIVIVLFDGEGMALDGKPYRNTYTWYLRMRDGKIREVLGFFDTILYTDFWNRVTPGSKTSE